MKEMKYDLLFVGGDLSGIQDFLYNITSKDASVSLKGRSNYLKQYMKDVCKSVLEATLQAGDQKQECIYDSGGKFYLKVDNTPLVRRAIDKVAREEERAIWDEHKGQLSVHIAYVPFSENTDGTVNVEGADQQTTVVLWQCMTAKFSELKCRKFKQLLTEDYASFFEVNAMGGNTRVCAVTGIEGSDLVPYDDFYVLPSVKEQIVRGKELQRKEKTLTFEEYAKDSYLGVLRMDVDGLGCRFQQGFASLANYRDFSNHLVGFFETDCRGDNDDTEIRQLWNCFHDEVNIIYAGGDDIFVVGHWNSVICFADALRNRFTEYCMQNNLTRGGSIGEEPLTISGGVVVVKPKFPIAKAALLAGEAEEAAKHHYEGKKNAFAMLGEVVSWDGEFDKVKEYKNELVKQIRDNGLPKSVLHRIITYGEMAKMAQKRKSEGKPADYSYVWHTAYSMTRLMEQYKEKNNVGGYNFCRRLRDKELIEENYCLWTLGARWAELELRDKND